MYDLGRHDYSVSEETKEQINLCEQKVASIKNNNSAITFKSSAFETKADAPLAELGFSNKAMKLFDALSIENLSDLLILSENQLKSHPGVGLGTISDIKYVLRKKNLKLGSIVILSQSNNSAIVEELPDKFFDDRLDNYNFSVRTSNIFEQEGIETFSDLMKLSEKELLQLRNFGKKSLAEINEFLESKNLSLNSPVSFAEAIDNSPIIYSNLICDNFLEDFEKELRSARLDARDYRILKMRAGFVKKTL